MSAIGVVLIADAIRSRSVVSFARERDRRLRTASAQHQRRGWILRPYAVTAWDEFQTVLASAAAIPQVVWDLRLLFQPMSLRIALGQGHISSMPARGRPVNLGGSGEAFELARSAMDRLKKGSTKYSVLTFLRTGERRLEAVVNCIFALQDGLLQRTTRRQWETILAFERAAAQDGTARLLGVSESTVSRNLKRASYWHVKAAAAVLDDLFAEQPPSVREGASR